MAPSPTSDNLKVQPPVASASPAIPHMPIETDPKRLTASAITDPTQARTAVIAKDPEGHLPLTSQNLPNEANYPAAVSNAVKAGPISAQLVDSHTTSNANTNPIKSGPEVVVSSPSPANGFVGSGIADNLRYKARPELNSLVSPVVYAALAVSSIGSGAGGSHTASLLPQDDPEHLPTTDSFGQDNAQHNEPEVPAGDDVEDQKVGFDIGNHILPSLTAAFRTTEPSASITGGGFDLSAMPAGILEPTNSLMGGEVLNVPSRLEDYSAIQPSLGSHSGVDQEQEADTGTQQINAVDQTIEVGDPIPTNAEVVGPLSTFALAVGSQEHGNPADADSNIMETPIPMGNTVVVAGSNDVAFDNNVFTPGGPARNFDGTSVSLGSSILVVGSQTASLASLASLVGNLDSSFTGATEVMIGAGTSSLVDSNLMVDTPAVTVDGMRILLGPSILALASRTEAPGPSNTGVHSAPLITVARAVFTEDANHVALGGHTFSPGGSAATINGTFVSLRSSMLIVGSLTTSLMLPSDAAVGSTASNARLLTTTSETDVGADGVALTTTTENGALSGGANKAVTSHSGGEKNALSCHSFGLYCKCLVLFMTFLISRV